MPVETATYIHDLNTADPTHTDGLNQADSHLRLIKSVLQNTFPNATAAITGTPAQLNRAATANATAGSLEVAANGSSGGQIVLDGVAGAGSVILSNIATVGQGGSLAITSFDHTNTTPTTVLSIDASGNVSVTGFVNAASIIQGGNALLPAGCILKWSGSVASVPAGWHLCDGTVGTPDLRDKFIVGAGLSYAVAQTGGQVNYSAVTDTQGTHSHTGATVASSPLAMSGSSDVQGAHSHGGATAATALDITMIPPHSHTVTAGFSTGAQQAFSFGTASVTGPVGTNNAGNGAGHAHGISVDGNHAHNIAVSNVPAHAHGIVNDGAHAHNTVVQTLPPFYALAFIMKL